MPTIRSVQQPPSGLAGPSHSDSDALASPDGSTSAPASVLLVEDDFLLRTVSAGTLADLGYRTYEVPDADQALTVLATNSEIKVLITDVNLPGMDGKTLAAEARRIRPEIRVLFVTGYSRKIVKDIDFTDGATGYLSKPFQHQDLDRALKRLLM